jgi:hypothetical protein
VFQIRRVEFSELVFYEEAKGSFFIHGWAAQSSTAFPITVEKSSSHHLSQNEIGGDNPCSRHLSLRTLIHSNPVTCDNACYQ